MKKKYIAIVLAGCLVVAIVFTYNYWGFGHIMVHSHSVTPTESYSSPTRSSISIRVFCGGRQIGISANPIRIACGEYTLSFGEYSSDYETPSDVKVVVRSFQTAEVRVDYTAKFGCLKVKTVAYNAYNETTQTVNSAIVVDNEIIGTGYMFLRFDPPNLGTHYVSFAQLEGYTAPASRTVQVEKGELVCIEGKYNKILTPQEQHYCWLRSHVRHGEVLDATSNVVTDKFLQWVLEDKIPIPFSYFYVAGDSYVTFYIAQYAGVLLDERINALDTIYHKLESTGIDLKQSVGERPFSLGIDAYRYEGEGEYIISVKLQFRMSSKMVEKSEAGTIYEYDKGDLGTLSSLFPHVMPAGIAIYFPDVVGLYVKLGESTKPLEDVYYFERFSNIDENDEGGHYDAYKGLSIDTIIDFYLSNSISQIIKLIETATMGSILLNPLGFCQSLLWQR